MDLKQFITETVQSIVDATWELQIRYDHSLEGTVINPPVSASNQLLYQVENAAHSYRRIEIIEFDVAVSASEASDSGGKAGLRVWAAEVGVDGKKNSTSEKVSRVKFTIPIALSQSTVEKQNIERGKAVSDLDKADTDCDEPES